MTPDPEKLDPSWPFHKQVHTIFEIIQTPLIPVLLEAAVSKVIRGLDQEVKFEPCKYSVDPDFPDEKVQLVCLILNGTLRLYIL